jgi:hypothetical protein
MSLSKADEYAVVSQGRNLNLRGLLNDKRKLGRNVLEIVMPLSHTCTVYAELLRW